MRLTLLRVAAASLLLASPAAAAPGLEDLDISLRGQAAGWLQATCTYHGLGWIEPENGRKALKRLILLIGRDLGHQAAVQAKTDVLERDPGCRSIWPPQL